MKRIFHKSLGFTLIELMVVMTIMSILAAIVVPAVGGTTTAGRASVLNNDKQAIQGSVDRYVGDHHSGPNGGYPISGGILPSATVGSVPLDWGASFVDPKEGTIKSFAKDYVKLTKPASDTTVFAPNAATGATICVTEPPGTICGEINVTVTIPHSGAVRSSNDTSGTLKDAELSYRIVPSGIKPNIRTTATTYTTAPDVIANVGWTRADGTGIFPVWRIDSGGNVQVNLKATEY